MTYTTQDRETRREIGFEVTGRINTDDGRQFEADIRARLALARKEAAALFIIMTEVEYMSSAGLRALNNVLKTAKRQKVPFELRDVSPRVAEVLELSGLDRQFTAVTRAPETR